MLKCKPAELQSKTKLEREMKVSIEWILKSVNYSFPKTVDETSTFILTKLIQIFRRRMFLMKIENLRLLVFSRLDFFFLSLSELESVRRYGKLPIFSSEINFLKFVDYQLSLTFLLFVLLLFHVSWNILSRTEYPVLWNLEIINAEY